MKEVTSHLVVAHGLRRPQHAVHRLAQLPRRVLEMLWLRSITSSLARALNSTRSHQAGQLEIHCSSSIIFALRAPRVHVNRGLGGVFAERIPACGGRESSPAFITHVGGKETGSSCSASTSVSSVSNGRSCDVLMWASMHICIPRACMSVAVSSSPGRAANVLRSITSAFCARFSKVITAPHKSGESSTCNLGLVVVAEREPGDSRLIVARLFSHPHRRHAGQQVLQSVNVMRIGNKSTCTTAGRSSRKLKSPNTKKWSSGCTCSVLDLIIIW